MDDLEGHFCYLDFLMKSNGSVNNQTVSAERHKNNICRERKIFVKAALQLLEAQEKNVISSLIVPSLIGNEADFDIIRSGYLKKGTRVSKIIPNMGLSSSKSSYTWKNKYVELRHGEFSYYDDTIEETPLASASLHSYHTSNHSKQPHHPQAGGLVPAANTAFAFKKSISLSPDICSCRVLQYAGGGRGVPHQSQLPSERDDESDHHAASGENEMGPPSTPSAHSAFVPTHAFEICLLGGQRRLFLTNSAEESREWVRDILTAMVGGKPAFSTSLPVDAAPHEQVDRKILFPGLGLSVKSGRSGRQEGGAGPYAGTITEYLNLQQRLHAVREEEGYKSIVRELVDRRVQVVVPVAFIKTKCSDGSFAVNRAVHMQGNHTDGSAVGAGGVMHFSGLNGLLPGKQRLHLLGSKSHHKRAFAAGESLGNGATEATAAVCVEKSQMWKDLQRDEVCVNGECVAGASDNSAFFGSQDEPGDEESTLGGGAEAIVGLLVRHIADAVDCARAELLDLLLKAQPQAQHANHHLLLQVMTEAQIVQCARSVLMMCNRTQSGGDAYYCVETLLRRRARPGDPESGSNSSDVFILAPLSIKTDPLSIEVDIVETDRSFFDPLLNGAQHQHQEKTASFATPNVGAGLKAERNQPSPRTDFIDALAASGTVNNGPSSPSVLRAGTFDISEGEPLSRRSSRRLHQFKLSLDEELGHHEKARGASLPVEAGSGTPSAPSKVLRSEFFNILEENSSQTSGSTTQEPHSRFRPHPAVDPQFRLSSGSEDVTVPLRVLSIDDPAPECQQDQEQDSNDMDMLGASYSNSHTPPYLLGNRDDSTVISDITFDTTAAFSQHTTVASYHHQQQQQQQQQASVSLGCAAEAEAEFVSPQPNVAAGKKNHLKPKSLMKMISSRMPTKQTMGLTPGGSMMNSFSSQDLQDTEHQPAHVVVGAVTPGRTRRGSHSSATDINNGTIPSSAGAMFTSLFKREKSRADKLDQLPLDPAAHAAATVGLRVRDASGVETEVPSRNSSPADNKKACVCVRMRVRGVSRYRVCSADPQGDPAQDNWAVMEGAFTQTFFVPAAVEGDSPHLVSQDASAVPKGLSQTTTTAKGVDVGKGHHPSSLPAAAMVVAGPVPAALSRLAMTDRLVSISAHKYECD